MTIAVLANDTLKKEWLSKTVPDSVELYWADSMRSLVMVEADAYFDLLFRPDPERTAQLKKVLPKPVFINAVINSTKETGKDFIRINAWPGFLERPVMELAVAGTDQNEKVLPVMDALQWKYLLVPDIPGMVTPRVISMIINEAYYTLGDQVSTRAEIDTAMKLGTNYPRGPFEWSEIIGLENIGDLLEALAAHDPRYNLSPALVNELANTGINK